MSKPTNAAIVDTRGRKWAPFDTKGPSGYVTYTEKAGEIHVPYGIDPVSTTVQAHELAHVRYTSKLWPNANGALKRLTGLAGTTPAIIGYAEDMRITALAGRLGIKALPAFGNEGDRAIIDRWVESFVGAGVPEKRVQRAIRFILNEHTTVLRDAGLSLSTLQQKDNAERYIVHCAQFIHNLLSKGEDPSRKDDTGAGKPEDKPATGEPTPAPSSGDQGDPAPADEDGDDSDSDSKDTEDTEDGDTSEGEEEGAEGDSDDQGDSPEPGEGDDDSSHPAPEGKGEGSGDGDATPGGTSGADCEGVLDLSELKLPDVRQAMLASVPVPPDTAKLAQEFQHVLDTAKWIPVTKIDRMPLVRRAAHSRRRGRKLGEQGTVLGSAYDAVAPNERRPFVAKRMGGAGGLTVVVDCSGSMAISDEQMDQLLTKHPQGVVVTYSSYTSRYGSNRAVVRVVASHGRVAAPDNIRARDAGGNGCDGPVLEWLAKQSGERVWVCDGVITETGDSVVVHTYESREAWLKAHRIKQFYSLDAYLTSLTS